MMFQRISFQIAVLFFVSASVSCGAFFGRPLSEGDKKSLVDEGEGDESVEGAATEESDGWSEPFLDLGESSEDSDSTQNQQSSNEDPERDDGPEKDEDRRDEPPEGEPDDRGSDSDDSSFGGSEGNGPMQSCTEDCYGAPPCGERERVIEISGIPGSFCSPYCRGPEFSSDCPVPERVTAVSQCMLEVTPGNVTNCALICRVGDGSGQCPDGADCQEIPNGMGLGVCTHPAESTDSEGFADESGE